MRRAPVAALLGAVLFLSACSPLHLLPDQGKPAAREAIVVLPGLGMRRHAQDDMRQFSAMADSAGFDVFVLDYRSRRSVERGVSNLVDLIEQNRLNRYERVHVFAYILGGYTLNLALLESPLPNLSRVVYDRSPLQELAPRLATGGLFGALVWVAVGPVISDLASTPYTQLLPADGRQIGLIVENRATKFVRKRKERALAMRPLTFDPESLSQDFDAVLHVPFNHDEMYTHFQVVGPELLHFFRFGDFTEGARRVPLGIDPFARE